MAAVNADMLTYGDGYLDNLSHEIASFNEPDKYLEPTGTMRKEVLKLSKKMYDFMKDFESYSNQNSLNKLLVDGFDNEQIWQEIQLQNNPCLLKFRTSLKGLNVDNICLISEQKEQITGKSKKQQTQIDKNKKIKLNVIKNTTKNSMEKEGFGDEFIEEENEDTEPRKKYKRTVVDDDFFQLREMEEYMEKLDQAEEMKSNDSNNENNESGNEIDFFKEKLASSDEEDTLQYHEFFDPPPKSNNSEKDVDDGVDIELNDNYCDDDYDDDDDVDDGDGESEGDMKEEEEDMSDDKDEEDVSETEEGVDEGSDVSGEEFDIKQQVDEGKLPQSTFERKQKQMQEKITKLEEENLSEKPWQLMGETVAKKRPVNSLLEEFLTFDHTSVGAPVVTEETTLSLEELVKQRIKDQSWDDVIRKEKPVVQPYEYKKAPELNQEKSKISLAEVYEKEYLKQAEDDKEEKENEEHVNIQNLLDDLFVQLSALSNFHFTPKPPQPTIKVITNAPSLQMEEVLPITMTESSQLAPEEVFEKKKGGLVCDDEKTEEDRKRERRQKKIKKKFAVKAKEKKEKLKAQKSGKVAKSERKQAIDSLKKGVRNTIVSGNKHQQNMKSSNDFFSKLQDEVKKNISKASTKGKKVAKKNVSAEFLKL